MTWPIFPETNPCVLKRVRLFGVFFDPQMGVGEMGEGSALKCRLYKQTVKPIKDHMASWPYNFGQGASPLHTTSPPPLSGIWGITMLPS